MRISRIVLAGTMCITVAGVPVERVIAQEHIAANTQFAMRAPAFTSVTAELLPQSRSEQSSSDAGMNRLTHGRDYRNQ